MNIKNKIHNLIFNTCLGEQAKKLAEVYNITDRKSVWWTEVKGETKLTEYDPQKDKK